MFFARSIPRVVTLFTDPSPLFAGEPPSLMLAHLVTPFKEGMGASLKKRPKASAILTIQPGSIRYRSLTAFEPRSGNRSTRRGEKSLALRTPLF
jgi:hypothetical protein